MELLRLIFNLTKEKLLKNENYLKVFRDELQLKSIKNIKCELIRLICNMLHINKTVQDYILDNNYLILCLSFTNLDEDN